MCVLNCWTNVAVCCFFLMIRRPPRSTLFPYTKRGDLAAGKTTFVKKTAEFINIKDEVTSPTFSLQHCYENKIFHYDMYNNGLDHFISLGMLEELEKEGLHFVEWGDDELADILSSAGIDTMTIDIEKISDDKREYTVCTRTQD